MFVQAGVVLIAFLGQFPFDVYEGPPYELIKAYPFPHGERLSEIFGNQPYYAYTQDGSLHAIHNGPQVAYDDPDEGDILPMFGRMYRVKSAIYPIVLEKIPNDKVPEGIAVDQASFVVPLKWNGKGRTTLSLLDAKKESELGAKEKVLRKLRLELANIKQHESGLSARLHDRWRGETHVQEVENGDIVTFGEHKFRVRNIVPRDEQKQITGWIELTRLAAEGEDAEDQ